MTLQEIIDDVRCLAHDLQRDIKILLLQIIGQNTTFLISHPDYVLTEKQFSEFNENLAKLKQGMPLAYVLGNQPFWSLEFIVNEHTLIPRADTEVLVEQILQKGQKMMQGLSMDLSVLDMGTGSGAIGVSVQHEQPDWQVTATDVSAEALKVAKKNAKTHNVKVDFFLGSWFDALPKQAKKFHIIASNPPYIDPTDEHLKDLTHEPISALIADRNGMQDIIHIISHAKSYLYDNAWLMLEHGYDQATLVQQEFAINGYTNIVTVKDYGGNDRVTIAKWN